MIVSALFILSGFAGFIYHVTELPGSGFLLYEWIWVLTLRLLAVVCGLLLWKGVERARWLAIGWLIYHLGLSALHSLSETLVHFGLLILVSVLLYLPASGAFFNKTDHNGKAS